MHSFTLNLQPGARLAMVPAVFLALAAGCGPGGPPTLEGFGEAGFEGDGDGDSTPPNPGDGDGEPDPPPPPPPSDDCVDADLGSQPEVFFSEVLDPELPNDFVNTCGEATPGSDFSFAWRAPFSAIYRVESFGDLPLAMQAREGGCDGTQINCAFGGNFNTFDIEVVEGQSYTFVLDTPVDEFTFFEFALYPIDEPPPPPPPPGSCPDGELPSQSQISINGSTVDAGNSFGSSCGGGEAPDRSFLFTPPVSGGYTIDTLGSDYDTMLYVFGAECGGPELACNDDTFDLLSEVEVELDEDTTYTIVVDGWDFSQGNFQLNVELTDGPPSLCDGVEQLPSQVPVSSDWQGNQGDADLVGDCSAFQLEKRFRWVAPATGLYRATSTAEIANSVLGVSTDGCFPDQFLCSQGVSSEVLFDAFDGQEILFSVDWQLEEENLGLLVELLDDPPPPPGCGESLGGDLPVFTSGNTAGSGNDHSGTCSVNNAPEREFHWVPPMTGTVRISTEGSNYDTLMYVREGGCGGDEIACVDDTFVEDTWFLWSAIDIDVQQGETISIFVDGYNGSGAFDLSITPI